MKKIASETAERVKILSFIDKNNSKHIVLIKKITYEAPPVKGNVWCYGLYFKRLFLTSLVNQIEDFKCFINILI